MFYGSKTHLERQVCVNKKLEEQPSQTACTSLEFGIVPKGMHSPIAKAADTKLHLGISGSEAVRFAEAFDWAYLPTFSRKKKGVDTPFVRGFSLSTIHWAMP